MTNDPSRRELIAQRHRDRQARIAQGYATFWLTRSSAHGVLSDAIDVWLVKPDRIMQDGYVFWQSSMDRAFYARWTLDQSYWEVRSATPATDRECVRVGPEPKIQHLLPS